MTKKTKILISCLVALVAVSLIAGFTYAFFTSETKTNINITSGNVSIVTTIGDITTSSYDWDEAKGEYVVTPYEDGRFTLGGHAGLNKEDNSILEIVNMTPGDAVYFPIYIKNSSTIAIQYRVRIAVEDGEELFAELTFDVETDNESLKIKDLGTSRVSGWVGPVTAPAEGEEDILSTLDVTIQLPHGSTKQFEDGYTCSIVITVEAVQSNGTHLVEDGIEDTQVTASTTISKYADDHDWTENTVYTSITMDKFVTLTTTKAGTNGTYADSSWHLYDSTSNTPTELTITVPDGYELESFVIKYSGGALNVENDVAQKVARALDLTNYGVVETGARYAISNSNTNSVTLVVSSDVHITDVEVVYRAVCDHDWNTDSIVWVWSNNYKDVTATFRCKNCGVMQTIEATVTESVTEKATCTDDGTADYKAEVVFEGVTYTDTKTGVTVKALGHDLKDVEAKAATCTEDGYTAHKACSRCDYKEDYATVSATGHSYDKWEKHDDKQHKKVCSECGDVQYEDHKWVDDRQEATCTTEGSIKSECSVCGETKEDTIDVIDHSYGEWIDATDGDCKTQSAVGHYECSMCGNWFDADKHEIPDEKRLGNYGDHSYGEWEQYDDEQHKKVCLICGEDVQYEDHKPEKVEGYDATCTENGLTDGSKCSVCNKELKAQETISATGHDYQGKPYVQDEEKPGYHYQVCKNCGKAGESVACTLEWTYSQDGHAYACADCGYVKETTGHSIGDPVHDEGKYSHTYTCETDGCGYSYSEACSSTGRYTSDGEDGHHQTCDECHEAMETVAHNLGTPVHNAIKDTHTFTCSDCNYTKTEACDYLENGVCDKCEHNYWLEYNGEDTLFNAIDSIVSGNGSYRDSESRIEGLGKNDTITFLIYSNEAQNVTLYAHMFGGAGWSNGGYTTTQADAFTVSVNGDERGPFSWDGGTNQGNYTADLFRVTLTQGLNTITITIGVAGSVNVYSIGLKPASDEFTLDHIEVDATGAITEFVVGGVFSHDGIKVTAYYSNGTDVNSKDITSDYTVSSPDMSKVGTQTVTVTYDGNTATYDIYVMPTYDGEAALTYEAETAILEGCKVNNSGTFVGEFSLGDKIIFIFDSTYEGKVQLSLSLSNGGSPKQEGLRISINEENPFIFAVPTIGGWTDFDVLVIGTINLVAERNVIVIEKMSDDTNVNVDYLMIAPVSGEVEEPTLERIEINTDGVQKQFYVGETFSYNGLVVTAYYSNDTHTVLERGYTVTGPTLEEMLTTGTKTVTVTYIEGDVTCTATYEINVIDNGSTDPEPGEDLPTYNGTDPLTIDATAASLDGIDKTSTNYVEVKDGSSVTFKFNSTVADSVDLCLKLASRYDNAFDIYVNGENVFSSTVTTGSNGTTGEFTFYAAILNEGVNTIEIRATTINDHFNLYSLTISPTSGEGEGEDDNLLKYNGEETTFGADKTNETFSTQSDNLGAFIGGLSKGKTISYTFKSDGDYTVELFINAFGGKYVGGSSPWAESLEKALIVSVNNTVIRSLGWNSADNNTDFFVGNINLVQGNTYTVTITMDENISNNFNFRYLKLAPSSGEIKLVNIEVNTDNVIKEFYVGEVFSYNGLVVTAHYSDGSATPLEVGDYTISTPDMTTTGKKTVTVTYEGATATYEITVMAQPLTYEGADLFLEAEDAMFGTGPVVANDGSVHGGKRVGNINKGDKFTFVFNSTVTDEVELYLSMGYAGNITDAFYVYVNDSNHDKQYSVSITNTGGWTTMKEFLICTADIVDGLNTIEIVANSKDVNLDYLKVAPKATYSGVEHKYGASSATYENCSFEPSTAGLDGNIFGGMSSDSVITYTINATVEGFVELRVSVAGGNGTGEWGWTGTQTDAFAVSVNGASLGNFDVGPTGWVDFKEIVVGYAKLNEGANTIVIQSVNANFNFNYLSLAPAPVQNYDPDGMSIGASNATSLTGGCQIEPNYGLFDGHIIGQFSSGRSFSFLLYSENEQSVDLTLWAAWPDLFTVQVYINGVPLTQEGISGQTTGWTEFGQMDTIKAATLNSGVNVITIEGVYGNLNFSHLVISPAA